MELAAMLRALGAPDEPSRVAARALHDALPAQAPAPWRGLAAALTVTLPPSARVLGIAGGQGAGKSTLARLLVAAQAEQGRRSAALSLDDFYRTRAERRALSREVHPLLATRGVPGTHDVALCERTLNALATPGRHRVPAFDKGMDDRADPVGWPEVTGPLELIILEGWCLGAPAQPAAALERPVNALEREEDPDGRWRRAVNDALRSDYARLWSRVDFWLYLRVPSLAAVRRWRTQQEQALPADRRMDAAAIDRFVAHYERLTRWMFEAMPARAQLCAVLNDRHGIDALLRRDSDPVQ